MAYNTNFIDPRDFLRDSQSGILENFAEIESFIMQDHENFSTADEGKHKQLTMPNRVGGIAPPPTSATEWSMFANEDGRTGILQAFFFTPNSVIRSFTSHSVDRDPLPNWMILPSGVVLKWVTLPQSPTQLTQGQPQTRTFDWPNAVSDRPFNNQYWAAVFPSRGNTDPEITYYVSDISDPTKVVTKKWIRYAFNNSAFGLDIFPSHSVTIYAIGD